LFETVDLRDAGMVHGGEEFPSRWNRASRSRSVATATGRIFNATSPLQSRVAGLVNFAHAPGANEAEDLVWTQPRARKMRLKEGPLLGRSIRRGGKTRGPGGPD
jgi:hypothetical protein